MGRPPGALEPSLDLRRSAVAHHRGVSLAEAVLEHRDWGPGRKPDPRGRHDAPSRSMVLAQPGWRDTRTVRVTPAHAGELRRLAPRLHRRPHDGGPSRVGRTDLHLGVAEVVLRR